MFVLYIFKRIKGEIKKKSVLKSMTPLLYNLPNIYMKIIPIKNIIIVFDLFLYFKDVGNSSINEILIIIPIIMLSKQPIIILLINGDNIKYAISPPIGSDIPDKKAIKIALFLLFVEA